VARLSGATGGCWRGVVLALLLGALTACAKPAAAPVAAPEPPPITQARPIAALLAAGDDSIPAFDNAIAYFRDLLGERRVASGSTELMSADRRRPSDQQLTLLPTLEARLQALKAPEGGSCLVFITSHGGHDQGVYLAPSRDFLTPVALDHALSTGCGTAPTVVIVSACYSGQFAVPPVAQPNRIVLTAARPDRTSFGCGAGFTYTYFDECLLGALPGAATWTEIYLRTKGCVTQHEEEIDATASEPQAAFGQNMRDFPAPLAPLAADAAARSPGASGATTEAAIRFTAAPIPFQPSLVPIGPDEKRRDQAALQAYLSAPAPKALAVATSGFLAIGSAADLAGTSISEAPSSGTPEEASESGVNADDTARLALERCELETGGACILFARDNQVTDLLPSGEVPLHPLLLRRSGALDPARTPFIRADQRAQIKSYLDLAEPKALALSPGRPALGIGTGATPDAAKSAAIDQCEAGGRDCLIYAEGDRVVLGWLH
jgi:Peptidase C13 family